MKKIIPNLLVAFGVLFTIWLIYIFLSSAKTKNEINLKSQETINKIQHERDSLLKANELQADSLQASTLRIHTLEFEKSQLAVQRKKLIQDHEKIHFVKFDSDSARLRELSILFPTIK